MLNSKVRAIGTMSAVAALVEGVTFALTPNQVALTNNQLTAATSSLAIGVGSTSCTGTAQTQTGMSITGLVAGGSPSSAFNFCITNTGSTTQSITMLTPTTFTSSAIPPSDVTLNVACGSTTATPVTLSALETTATSVDTSLAAGATDQCTATATLSSSYTGNGSSITPFELDFTGTTTSS